MPFQGSAFVWRFVGNGAITKQKPLRVRLERRCRLPVDDARSDRDALSKAFDLQPTLPQLQTARGCQPCGYGRTIAPLDGAAKLTIPICQPLDNFWHFVVSQVSEFFDTPA